MNQDNEIEIYNIYYQVQKFKDPITNQVDFKLWINNSQVLPLMLS